MNRNYVTLVALAVVLAVALAIAGVSFGAVLPFAVVLMCPLMMIFMMKGMGGMHGGRADDSEQPKERKS